MAWMVNLHARVPPTVPTYDVRLAAFSECALRALN